MSKMQIAPEDRPLVKAQCVAMMFGLKLDESGRKIISRFVEDYLGLSKREEKIFQGELDRLIPADQRRNLWKS